MAIAGNRPALTHVYWDDLSFATRSPWSLLCACASIGKYSGGAVAQLGARLDGIEEVVGSNPIGSTKISIQVFPQATRLGKSPVCSLSPSSRAVFSARMRETL
jgi:hypothetical protein